MIEFFNVVFRMIHVVAAIMWIGNSLLFTWFELNLRRNDEDGEESLGSMNMLHGGGIFFLQKRIIDPKEIPHRLHIFKWQSYTTWISGFLLLVTLFYTRGATLLLDPAKTNLPGYMGAVISFASLVGGWLFYDLLWRSPVRNKERLGLLISFAGLIAYGYWLDTVFNGRAVYLQMGAMMGTMMSANVFFHIMVNQKKMMDALLEGKPHDLKLGKQAKIRSTHNHYITFPVIFLMLSAHFPSTYGSPYNIPIAAVAIITLALIKHLMNCYHSLPRWKEYLALTFISSEQASSPSSSRKAKPPKPLPLILKRKQGSKSLYPPVATPVTSPRPALSHLASMGYLAAKSNSRTAQPSLPTRLIFVRASSTLPPKWSTASGYAPAMPHYATVLNDEQVDQLVAYIKSLK